MIRFWDRSFDSSDILLDKKLCKEKCISYKASTSAKPSHMRFDKIDGCIRWIY